MLHHPYWASEDLRPSRQRDWASAFLLGLAFQLRLVQAARTAQDEWAVRLSALGRWLLGLEDAPSIDGAYLKTLLVQPNLEVVAYRQGLTPALVARLTRFATWQSLGSACTLQLGPESIYRALEGGLTFDDILRTLEQHGTRATCMTIVTTMSRSTCCADPMLPRSDDVTRWPPRVEGFSREGLWPSGVFSMGEQHHLCHPRGPGGPEGTRAA